MAQYPMSERGWAVVNATKQATALPKPTVGASGAGGANVRATHMIMSVEGGDVRYRASANEDPNEDFGTLLRNGTTLEWMHPEADYGSAIANMRVIAVNGAAQVRLNIAWWD